MATKHMFIVESSVSSYSKKMKKVVVVVVVVFVVVKEVVVYSTESPKNSYSNAFKKTILSLKEHTEEINLCCLAYNISANSRGLKLISMYR